MTTSAHGKSRLLGRILEVNFKHRTGEIYDAAGNVTRVAFTEELSEQVKHASRLQIIATVESRVDEQDELRTVNLREIEVVDDLGEDFWNPPGLSELVRRQGVRPIRSVGQFEAPSLVKEDAEDIVSELRALRI